MGYGFRRTVGWCWYTAFTRQLSPLRLSNDLPRHDERLFAQGHKQHKTMQNCIRRNITELSSGKPPHMPLLGWIVGSSVSPWQLFARPQAKLSHPLGKTPSLRTKSQWLIIMGYFKPILIYFGVWWPIISSYLAVQVILNKARRPQVHFQGPFRP